MKLIDTLISIRVNKLLDEIEELQDKMDYAEYITPLSIANKKEENTIIDGKIRTKLIVIANLKYI